MASLVLILQVLTMKYTGVLDVLRSTYKRNYTPCMNLSAPRASRVCSSSLDDESTRSILMVGSSRALI
ncbi:hypothetical protein PR003_g28588 [Phytophthora rubi]|uniref:Uncharacterized protein n=1 Tax=Phytophthora rubi TaxID=129364 RepID=A0A6A4BSY7_9STRA|nr:hypothetical protein PR002_g27483 [Phytophthora rubi]KAE8969730.1 hypothetical protein PR001_g27413 [Phytophthora rubi]KAE9278207.1 hypothetical protein PR003_g28588 [Phytophthora rubi]